MRGGVSGEAGSPAVSDECYLLWGDVKTDRPQVDLPVVVHTGNDEEDPGTLRSSFPQPAQSEDDGSLVLLDHLVAQTTLSELRFPGGRNRGNKGILGEIRGFLPIILIPFLIPLSLSPPDIPCHLP